jgi:hypothetical protein
MPYRLESIRDAWRSAACRLAHFPFLYTIGPAPTHSELGHPVSVTKLENVLPTRPQANLVEIAPQLSSPFLVCHADSQHWPSYPRFWPRSSKSILLIRIMQNVIRYLYYVYWGGVPHAVMYMHVELRRQLGGVKIFLPHGVWKSNSM